MSLSYCYSKIKLNGTSIELGIDKIIKLLEKEFNQNGYAEVTNEEESHVSYLLLSDGEEWLHFSSVGNSTFDFNVLISSLFSVVYINVLESNGIKISLYQNSKHIDTYANLKFPWNAFSTIEEAEAFSGDFVKWFSLIGDKGGEKLKTIWKFPFTIGLNNNFSNRALEILKKSSPLFGWDLNLCKVAYVLQGDNHEFDGTYNLLNNKTEEINKYVVLKKHFKDTINERYMTVSDIFGDY